jgi:hypothetical protein
MSRVSLSRRLDAIRNAAERIDPQAARVFRMQPAVRMRYDLWRREIDRMHDEIEREHGPGASYAAYLDGTLATPDPPRAVAEALGAAAMPVLTVEMSTREVAEVYADYAAT